MGESKPAVVVDASLPDADQRFATQVHLIEARIRALVEAGLTAAEAQTLSTAVLAALAAGARE